MAAHESLESKIRICSYKSASWFFYERRRANSQCCENNCEHSKRAVCESTGDASPISGSTATKTENTEQHESVNHV